MKVFLETFTCRANRYHGVVEWNEFGDGYDGGAGCKKSRSRWFRGAEGQW
jgi:hypothetical protein